MRPEEVTGLGTLAGDASAGVALQVRDMHEAIARRVFAALGRPGAPVELVHDRIASLAYDGARGLSGGLVRMGSHAIAATRPSGAAPLESSTFGRLALGALNGVWGDRIQRQQNALALTMTLRRGGRDVAVAPRELAAAYPDATPKLAVFVHGLCETDDAWKLGAERHIPYGTRLQAELGFTPLYVRYNSGRHISENGRELALLLDDVTRAWPVEVAEIALIGHSMGGLVSRSACHYASTSDALSDSPAWPANVRHVFTLGSPHCGAPLEKAATAATGALARLPETRGFARVLKARSSGIKDLGHGYLVDEDWLDQDPDAFVQRAGSVIPFLDCANHYFVCATVSRDANAPLGRIVGDLLVLRESAWGQKRRGERMQFSVDHYRHLGEANHFDLLNHPAIYDQIRGWLAPRPTLAPSAS
jgi:pimeloyl-ACP methyl ester carboxylesterase